MKIEFSKTLKYIYLDDCDKLIKLCLDVLERDKNADITIVASMLRTSRTTLWRRLKKCNMTWAKLKKRVKHIEKNIM